MQDTSAPAEYSELADVMRSVAEKTLVIAPELRLLFVTNLRPEVGEITDLGPAGVTNIAQYYSRTQADEIIRNLQNLGVTVEPFFSEIDLVRELVGDVPRADPRRAVVYSTAEGGSGSGRRALIPALCNLLSLPVLNSGAHASSLVRHKSHACAVLHSVGVRAPGTWQFDDGAWMGGNAPPAGARVIVKPSYESMGIGVGHDSVRIVDSGFATFIADKNRKFGQPAVVQEFISGREVGVPVVRMDSTYALPPIVQRRLNGEDYHSVAKTFRDEHVFHDLSHARFEAPRVQLAGLRDAATLAFDALEMRGVGRIDFRVDADGRAWAFDTNGEPPPVPGTCWSAAMECLGFSFPELLAVWLGVCLRDHGLISRV